MFPNPGANYPSGVMDPFFGGNDCSMLEKVIVNQLNSCQLALHQFKYIDIFFRYYRVQYLFVEWGVIDNCKMVFWGNHFEKVGEHWSRGCLVEVEMCRRS